MCTDRLLYFGKQQGDCLGSLASLDVLKSTLGNVNCQNKWSPGCLSLISYHLLHRFHIFEHHIFRTTMYLKGCSRGAIVTAIYFSQLMECIKLCYQSCSMWAIILNPVQVICCNKAITCALTPCVALKIMQNTLEYEFVIRFLPLLNRSETVVKRISSVFGTTLRRDREFIEQQIWTVTETCLLLPFLCCSIVKYFLEISCWWIGFFFWYIEHMSEFVVYYFHWYMPLKFSCIFRKFFLILVVN